ncbi:MAG: 50S ribosomal protein L19e [Candidatus Caldarchaeum sp.]|nr:50S ribosomal protein L19e [Candidatus Caldarchaeum sp.]MDW8063664.1 50S ribosomal protein L19e [Candidatus Caldarchaeum sp.]MDW8435451.1 50S ribosomal protein L19e [Candidatus Caldarchaeum sp.]
MTLEMQRRMAADLLKCGTTRVRFDPERLEDIESAITRAEIRKLIADGAIYKIPAKGVSRARLEPKRKRGEGSREGGKHSIIPRKTAWIQRVRSQRRYLQKLRDKGVLEPADYRTLYSYVKAGNFKSVAALKEFIRNKGLLKEGA